MFDGWYKHQQQQTRNKSHTKNIKSFDKQADTKHRYYDAHKNNQNHHHNAPDPEWTVQFTKKKIQQTEIQKHNRNFNNNKTDQVHLQWIIILRNTFGKKCDL